MSGLLNKLSPAIRANKSDDLPLFYTDQSMGFQRGHRNTPKVSVTLAELLMSMEYDQNGRSQALDIALASNFFSSVSSYPLTSPSPFVLSFKDLTYSVKIKNMFNPLPCCGSSDGDGMEMNTKILLNGISGEAKEGEMMAVLGASGSGKSTLIDALANRIAKESLHGSITLNGEVLESSLHKVISAYVMQDDLLFPMLTVEETLMFSAEFRLPRSLSKKKKQARVQALIDQLGLRNAATTVIGDEGHRGVSGGERRRVSIGIDIIHDPIILFLDEPTSGLDSTSAYMVVKVLQRVAKSGSIVIMSIHQPSYRILGLLDKLLFLSRGNTNKTEFALDLIRELEDSPEGTKTLVEFHKQWRAKETLNQTTRNTNVSLKDAINASISREKLVSACRAGPEILRDRSSRGETNLKSTFQTFANPFWTEILVIAKRSMLNSRRQPELFGIRLGAVLVTGTILATMFWKLDNSPRGIQERLGFFAFAMSTTFYTCAEAIPVFL
ncbi:hypothetical protein YC2023_110477 [Brassica napus]